MTQFMLLAYLLLFVSCAGHSLEQQGETQHNRNAKQLKTRAMSAKDYFVPPLQIAFAEAIESGNTNRMCVLISQGANINYIGKGGVNPLFWSLIKQNYRSFKFLLNNEVNVNYVTTSPPFNNALDLAVQIDDSRYLSDLLNHGANPNIANGNTPESGSGVLFRAILQDRTNMIAILLKGGADIEGSLPNGTTPLHYAIYCGSYEAALFLYHAGANPLTKNKLGYSPVETMTQFSDNAVRSSADKNAYKLLLKEFTSDGRFKSKANN